MSTLRRSVRVRAGVLGGLIAGLAFLVGEMTNAVVVGVGRGLGLSLTTEAGAHA